MCDGRGESQTFASFIACSPRQGLLREREREREKERERYEMLF